MDDDQASDAAAIPKRLRFDQCARFPAKARYAPFNHPDLRGQAIVEMIGGTISQHLASEGQRLAGMTWLERFPAFIPWLEEQGFTPEEAVEYHEVWLQSELAKLNEAERVGVVPFKHGFAPQIEVVRSLPDMFDLLNGRVTIADIPSPKTPQANGGPVDEESVARSNWLAAIREFTGKLKGAQRRVVELLVEANGTCPIADIATDKAVGWVSPYKASVDSLRRELNDKLRHLKTSVRVWNNCFELVHKAARKRVKTAQQK